MSSSYDQIPSNEIIDQTVKALEKNGISTQVVETGEQAKEAALKLIEKGSEVLTSSSVTVDQIGLGAILNDDTDYVSVRNKFMGLMGQPERHTEMRQISAAPKYAVSSVHAVTQDGKIMIASATGSQLGPAAYGADHVVFIVGVQKISKNLEDGLKRIEEYVVPLEDVRATEAYGKGTSFSKLLVINKDQPGRIQVIFIKEKIGF